MVSLPEQKGKKLKQDYVVVEGSEREEEKRFAGGIFRTQHMDPELFAQYISPRVDDWNWCSCHCCVWSGRQKLLFKVAS